MTRTCSCGQCPPPIPSNPMLNGELTFNLARPQLRRLRCTNDPGEYQGIFCRRSPPAEKATARRNQTRRPAPAMGLGTAALTLIHHLTSAQLGFLVDSVASSALESADMGVGVVWRSSAATFSLTRFSTRFSADAADGRRSARTGLGANRGGESTGELSVCTATVWGW
jgi:hypothetical protein